MSTTIPIEGTSERVKAEIHEGEVFLSLEDRGGHLQRVPSMEAAVGRAMPDAPLDRRLSLAGQLLAMLAADLPETANRI